MIKLISIFDKNEDFIILQHQSILKHIKGDYEYIIFNNGSNEEQSNKIKKICEELNIKHIKIDVNYSLGGPSDIAGSALNESFKHLKNELVFKIDSDMFFISDIKLIDFFEEYELSYVPIICPIKNESSMWSGIFGINMKKIEQDLDFRPNVIPSSDTFGVSLILTKDERYRKKLFELYNLYNITDNVLETNLNTNCVMKFKDNSLTYLEKPNYPINSVENYLSKYNKIIEILDLYNFPKPYSVDFIQENEKNFIFHFKSSNWCPWYNEEYVELKKEALKKLLNNYIE